MTQPPPTGQGAPSSGLGSGWGGAPAGSSTAGPRGYETPYGGTPGGQPQPGRSNGNRGGSTGVAEAPTVAVPYLPGPDLNGRPGSPSPGAPGASPTAGRSARPRGPRRARLQLRHIDPWTVLKFSCVLAIALFFVWLIVVGVLFGALDAAGIIDKINNAYTTIQSGNAKPPITARIVFGGAAIIGVVNIVLFVALSTIGSVVYNLCADLVGGIEITLSER